MSTDSDQVTIEAVTDTKQATGQGNKRDDAEDIRHRFGWRQYDREPFVDADRESLVPNCLEHSWDASAEQTAGGTDWLCTGKPGCGKSTLALYLCQRLMSINDETIVWRGSTSRSEWLPFAPWATVCLPEEVDVSARLEPQDPTGERVEVDLEDLVREVKRYANPVHLNQDLLEPGQFHVVYPDPRMFDCQAIYEDAPEKQYESPSDRGLFEPEDPLNHWWFAWMLARIEEGPHTFMSIIFDEIGDIAPEAARSDAYGTFQKIELLRDCYVDARKFGLSIFAFGHSERDIHNLIRHKIRWRVAMSGGANPTTASDVVGFDSVPMDYDMCSMLDLGEAVVFNEQNFEKIGWRDAPSPLNRTLKVGLGGGS